MPLPLEIRGLSKRFAAGAGGCFATATALRGVELCAAAGEVVALVGPRGAGKSTLLLCAAGLLRPDAGLVLHHGVPVRRAGATGVVYAGSHARAAASQDVHAAALLLIDEPLGERVARSPPLLAGLLAAARGGAAVVLAVRELADLVALRALAPRRVHLREGRVVAGAAVPVRRVADARRVRVAEVAPLVGGDSGLH